MDCKNPESFIEQLREKTELAKQDRAIRHGYALKNFIEVEMDNFKQKAIAAANDGKNMCSMMVEEDTSNHYISDVPRTRIQLEMEAALKAQGFVFTRRRTPINLIINFEVSW